MTALRRLRAGLPRLGWPAAALAALVVGTGMGIGMENGRATPAHLRSPQCPRPAFPAGHGSAERR